MYIRLLQIPEHKVKDLLDAFRDNGIGITGDVTYFEGSRQVTLVERDKAAEVHLHICSDVGGVEAGFAVLQVQPPWGGLRAHFKNNRLRHRVERILQTCGAGDIPKRMQSRETS
jgi:hypothetical protein